MKQNHRFAIVLALITIVYNILEGAFSIYFGMDDEQLSLMGFGFDSFIETISATGVLVMLIRTLKLNRNERFKFEKNALRITAAGFFVLSIVLLFSVGIRFFTQEYPHSTLAGTIISLLSISGMFLLVYFKMREGKKLNSDALIADARCNIVCIYMSGVLLVTSLLVEFFDVRWFDLVGTIGIVYFSLKEGVEAWNKSKGEKCACE